MNFPQENDKVPAFMRQLNQDMNDLKNVVRALRLNSSPTVRVDQTSIGTTLHATPPAPVTPEESVSAWVWP